MKTFRLIGENVDSESFSIIRESVNGSSDKHYYIEGPYTEANRRNRNGRIYPLEEMASQIRELDTNFIQKNRCLGELEHPNYAEINAANAAIKIESIRQDGNFFIGRSKVLDTPRGQIIQTLLKEDVQLGVSSRALGNVNEDGVVTDLQLITFDCVADPSSQEAFVNGILESKKWICNSDGKYEEVFEGFENNLKKLPKKSSEREVFLRETILKFVNSLK